MTRGTIARTPVLGIILVGLVFAQQQENVEAARHYKVALVALEKNDLDMALKELRICAQLAPENALVHYNLAVVQSKKEGQSSEALTSLQRAMNLGLPPEKKDDAEALLAKLTYDLNAAKARRDASRVAAEASTPCGLRPVREPGVPESLPLKDVLPQLIGTWRYDGTDGDAGKGTRYHTVVSLSFRAAGKSQPVCELSFRQECINPGEAPFQITEFKGTIPLSSRDSYIHAEGAGQGMDTWRDRRQNFTWSPASLVLDQIRVENGSLLMAFEMNVASKRDSHAKGGVRQAFGVGTQCGAYKDVRLRKD
jgi:hypothetical protein